MKIQIDHESDEVMVEDDQGRVASISLETYALACTEVVKSVKHQTAVQRSHDECVVSLIIRAEEIKAEQREEDVARRSHLSVVPMIQRAGN
ncbi:MAG: hypothetical protein LC754_10475 [Acidobacteria bacterium]|nr:hypothetical protein [Acidobacteriota bacterium]